MPKYAKPLKGGSHVRRFSHFTPVAGATTASSSTSIENLSKAASTVGAGAGGGSISGKHDFFLLDDLTELLHFNWEPLQSGQGTVLRFEVKVAVLWSISKIGTQNYDFF